MNRADFLIDLVSQHNWTDGAELGLWDGRTYLKVLEHCPDLTLWGVDRWEHTPDEMEHYRTWNHTQHERKVRTEARKFGDRAKLLRMTTTEAVSVVPSGLDFVFIDADHRTEAVRKDIRNWRSKLASRGWLIGHDIDWPSVQLALEAENVSHETGPDNVWFVRS